MDDSLKVGAFGLAHGSGPWQLANLAVGRLSPSARELSRFSTRAETGRQRRTLLAPIFWLKSGMGAMAKAFRASSKLSPTRLYPREYMDCHRPSSSVPDSANWLPRRHRT